jgi:hypothetical protein
MPPLKEVLARTVKQWKSSNERGDVSALIRQLDATLSPLLEPALPKAPRHPR